MHVNARTLTAIVFVTAAPFCAYAQLIQPDTAVASSQFNSDFRAENAINGSGLPAPFDPSDAHADYSSAGGGNHWTTDGSAPLNEFITFGFTTPQDLVAFHMWNHRSNIISANPGYDVTLFDLTFLAADGTSVLGALNDVAALPDVATGQTFSFPEVQNVSFVRFDIEGVQSSPTFTGLAEVAFSIPEPASATLLAFVAVAGLMVRRRR